MTDVKGRIFWITALNTVSHIFSLLPLQKQRIQEGSCVVASLRLETHKKCGLLLNQPEIYFYS